MSKEKNVDMLHGPLASRMLLFAIPLIASGILQQSFNSVDVAVVGRWAGSHALAAVGSNGPVIGLMINLFLGLSVGANVVIANFMGQRNRSGVRNAVSASAFLALASGLVMVTATLLLARPLLELLDTPIEVIDLATIYLRIYALGMPFMMIYNFASAILRSVGDTRRPFYSLVAAGVVNVVLNLVFVICFGMGVSGVAWATVFSNIVNAAITTGILMRERSEIHLDLRDIRPNWAELSKIFAVGFPAGLQSMVFSISNVFILSAINSFGAMASAGSAAALNYELYCYFVINAFGQTAVAFTGQNFGAGQIDRCRRILWIALAMSTSVSAVLNIGITWQRHFFCSAFTTDPEVMVFAAERVAAVLLFQFVACYYEMTGSVLRGMGHSMAPAMITIFGTCVLRLLWVHFFPAGASFGTLLTIYPVSWMLTNVLMFVAWRRAWRSVSSSSRQISAA